MPCSVAVVGASGLLGTILCDFLREHEYKVIRVSHENVTRIPRTDVVINLAGCSITGLWTQPYKEKILKSRVETTELLVKNISPQLYIGASAIGYYGDSGKVLVTEDSPPGTNFLASVVRAWEEASAPLSCRRVLARMAPVLTKKAGFLGKMAPLFRLGLGQTIGPGSQWQSWIHYLDLARSFVHIIENRDIEGPVNLSAPSPVTQKAFADTLAQVLHKPRFLNLPAPLVRLLPGGMGEELLLASCRASPKVLLSSGFTFMFPDLEPALKDLFQNP
jgi:uncharacterized protein (TIGR01777 family)